MKLKKRSLLILAGVLAGSLVLAAAGVWFIAREPVYDGRPVSLWIDDLAGPVNPTYGSVGSDALPKLLGQIPGKEIVPALASTLQRGRTSFDRLYSRVYPRLPLSIAGRLEMPNPARDAQLRYRAALILYYLGEDARGAAPKLIKALDDSNTEVRRVAANALGNFKDHPGATEALRLALADPHDSVRGTALRSLSHVEHGSVVALEAGRLLADPEPGVRMDAALLLKNLGPEAKPAIPALIDALQDENADVLRFAAQALGRIGPEARAAVPGLLEVLEEDRPYTRTTVQWALKRIDPGALKRASSLHRD